MSFISKYLAIIISLLQQQIHIVTPGPADRVIWLTEFNRCSWSVDLVTSREPTKVWDTYFNEKGSYEATEFLEDPNITQFLQTVTIGEGRGYYVFPYFVLLRAACDTGYYDDSYYRILMHGTYPTIIISYSPKTSRDPVRYSWRTFSTGGLTNVQPDADNFAVPSNPNYPNCYLEMCHPAFVVPLVFLQIPIFEVTVEPMDVFSKATTRIHVSPYISRKGDGVTSVELGSVLSDVTPFFPVDRIDNSSNPQLLTDSVMSAIQDESHFPLDAEDFIDPQYTYGSAPVIVFSGFYNPDLIVMADPDLNNIRPIRWERNPLLPDGSPDENYTIFDHALTCRWLDKKYSGDSGDDSLDIPIYSSGEGEFWNELVGTNYRKRYKPMQYQNASIPKAIFEAISLEDRLLLITYSGLVTLYGTSNITVHADTTLKSIASEKLRKCFKFVRVSRHAAQDVDLIVAATYHYMEQHTYKNEKGQAVNRQDVIDQEIWMGKLTTSGKPLTWMKIGHSKDAKSMQDVPEGAEAPQVRQICDSVKNNVMKVDNDTTVFVGHCWVLDGTPAVGQVETIQVLIEMRIVHLPTVAFMSNTYLGMVEQESEITFYIIAQHTPVKSYSKQIWEVMTVIPRRPCVEAHRQKIQTIQRYGSSYFNRDKTINDLDQLIAFKKNCHYAGRKNGPNDLYLNRMTYTRQNNGHLFLYGNKLVHSTNGGHSFAYMEGFPDSIELEDLQEANNKFIGKEDEEIPKRLEYYLDFIKKCHSHVIKVMAFSNGGHFAFLTSKRHLYLGSSGTVEVIKLRPSPGYSMIRTAVTLQPGLHDGRPFSLLYDSQDNLFEMVVTVDSNLTLRHIRKRPVPWKLIIQNTQFVEKLQAATKNPSDEKGQNSGKEPTKGTSATDPMNNVFRTAKSKFTVYCPFGDPYFYQNYSTTMSRVEDFMIPPPLQHSSLGMPLAYTSLMGFQASSYSLMHRLFLKREQNTYSHIGTHIFKHWVAARADQAQLGFFRFFTGDPEKYGIVVNPHSFKQLPQDDETAGRDIPSRIYLDYNQVVLLVLQFSISTTATIDQPDYNIQKLNYLQLAIDNGNGTILEVGTERIVNAKQAAVKFNILLSLNKQTAHLKQHLPGDRSTVIPLLLHFVGGFGNCFANDAGNYIGDYVSTEVHAGCRPSTQIQFNWNATLRSMRFRSPKEWMGMNGDCYNDETVCFLGSLPLVLHLEVYDSAKQTYTPYTGKYTMRVVAGGYSPDKMESYSKEKQEAYNIPGKSDISLIWLEWNMTTAAKIKTKMVTHGNQTQQVILQAGTSAIKWACHTLSPCARVWPTPFGQSVFYFKIRISNRDIDEDTLCLYERDIIIQLYGFKPSPELQLLISFLFCLFIVIILRVMYFCCRNQRKVWRANKVKMYGWLQIIIDTFPKGKKGMDMNSALTQQIRRDEILMSLEGHLRVPVMTGDIRIARQKSKFTERSKSPSSGVERKASSRSSSDSESSTGGHQNVLPSVNPRHAPATWTDMIYDQIITKRIHAIIDRNNQMKKSILKKVDYSGKGQIMASEGNVETEQPADKSTEPPNTTQKHDKQS